MGFGYKETTAIYYLYLQVILNIFNSQNCRLRQQRFKISADQNLVVVFRPELARAPPPFIHFKTSILSVYNTGLLFPYEILAI